MSNTGLNLHLLPHGLRMLFVAVAVCSCILVSTGSSFADVLWYALEDGSRVEFSRGGGMELTGRIGIMGCGEAASNDSMPLKRAGYLLYALELDRSPEELKSQLTGYSTIPLFGGPGDEVSGGFGSMVIHDDGKLKTFQWWLRHQLEHDYGSEATVYHRNLVNDDTGIVRSNLKFRDERAICPEILELYLSINDLWTSYRPEPTYSLSGEQTISARHVSSRNELVGRVSLIATAIPGSEEKIDPSINQYLYVTDSPNAPSPRSIVSIPAVTVPRDPENISRQHPISTRVQNVGSSPKPELRQPPQVVAESYSYAFKLPGMVGKRSHLDKPLTVPFDLKAKFSHIRAVELHLEGVARPGLAKATSGTNEALELPVSFNVEVADKFRQHKASAQSFTARFNNLHDRFTIRQKFLGLDGRNADWSILWDGVGEMKLSWTGSCPEGCRYVEHSTLDITGATLIVHGNQR